MTRSSAFPPVLDARTRVLVLGSLPGPESLRRAEYYAHPRNDFWRLIGPVVGRDLDPLPYPDRLDALRQAGVGLWDVVASAVRQGAADAAIREAEPADLAGLVAGLPALRAVAFNGATAARIGRRQLAAAGPALLDLPSSSPAHAAMPLAGKRARWAVLAGYLG